MSELDYPPGSFDLLWAEGSAYIIGFEHALRIWKPLLAPGGHLFVTDAVWFTESPSSPCQEFWQREYPDMKTLPERARQAKIIDYEVIESFSLPKEDFKDFYDDMEEQVERVREKLGNHIALDDLRREIAVSRQFGGEYGYGCLILRVN